MLWLRIYLSVVGCVFMILLINETVNEFMGNGRRSAERGIADAITYAILWPILLILWLLNMWKNAKR